jgi:parallel beta-helix repeat protein
MAPPPGEIVLDRDDIEITRSVVVKPGTYHVCDRNGDGVLRIVADGVTVTLDGVTLDGAAGGAEPDGFEGIGIAVADCSNVRIEGGALRGFRVAVRGARAHGIRLEGVDVSGNRAMRLRSTPAREDQTDWLWPHENDRGEWETRYGAGISLSDCEHATVERCRARGSQNGLLLLRCRAARVRDNDFSFLSGWGIAMYRSTRCEVVDNRCDFCVRGYSHGVYARGQDSAGILAFEQCSDNVFARNSATHSGDGFFLYAGHETTQRTGQGGSNRNVVDGNDFSQAVANGIEATFSAGNRFTGNVLDECDHGVWAGYSYETLIRGNTIRRCGSGVSIEHGHDNTIEENTIEDCRRGIHLWWDDDAEFLASAYGRAQDSSSSRNTVRANRVTGGGTALLFDSDTGSRVEGNVVAGAAAGIDARGGTTFAVCDDNVFEDARARQPDERPRGGMPRGREHIVIGEWGPLDPRLPALVPFGATGASAAPRRVADRRFRRGARGRRGARRRAHPGRRGGSVGGALARRRAHRRTRLRGAGHARLRAMARALVGVADGSPRRRRGMVGAARAAGPRRTDRRCPRFRLGCGPPRAAHPRGCFRDRSRDDPHTAAGDMAALDRVGRRHPGLRRSVRISVVLVLCL